MADLEFFFDPVCPFAWVTSRWVEEVRRQREYDVVWRIISLKVINEERDADEVRSHQRTRHVASFRALRVIDEVQNRFGGEAVGPLYTALGTALHNDGRRDELVADPQGFLAPVLAGLGLPADLAAHTADESHDAAIRASTELAVSRTGSGVGTPIITFHPDRPTAASFFGPVISSIPRGEEAVRLWDAVEMIATTSNLSELKRSDRPKLSFI